jgi:hypothetical protein
MGLLFRDGVLPPLQLSAAEAVAPLASSSPPHCGMNRNYYSGPQAPVIIPQFVTDSVL